MVETGSVISGTMRPEDIIPELEWVLDCEGVEYNRPESVNKLMGTGGNLNGDDELTDNYMCEVQEYLNELFDALNDIAPEGHYFGSHPGNGADYGFWPCDDYNSYADGDSEGAYEPEDADYL